MNGGVVLGFDTSNYKTSAAWFRPEDGAYCSRGRLLEVPAGTLGLRQSEALFQHVRRLPEIAAAAFDGAPVLAVGYSDRPRAVEGSYMPCFLAGESAARTLASALGVACDAWSHQQGHLASAAFSCGRLDLLQGEFLAWHLSGGTTELLHVMPGLRCEIVGGTEDISAGQLIDRTGVLLGLPFPAGPDVDAQARMSEKQDHFTVKLREAFFSLSGVENQMRDRAARGMSAPDLCRFVLLTVAEAVRRATGAARGQTALPVLVSGGVSANTLLRALLGDEPGVLFSQNGLGGDNALGAALLTAQREGLL